MLSNLHMSIVNFLREKYPFLKILLEYKMPKTALRIDIFIPDLDLGIEVQGIQHYEQNAFFHKDATSFLEANLRDKEKAHLAFVNNIELLYVRYDEKNHIARISKKIEEKVFQMDHLEVPFVGSQIYDEVIIEDLICPLCRLPLEFKDSVDEIFGSVKTDVCCGRRYILVKNENNYSSTTEKVR